MRTITCLVVFTLIFSSLSAQNIKDTAFSESEITLKTPTGTIFGTLTVPKNTTTSPIVLIIAGSGPTDRNGNAGMGLQTNAYKMVAEGFAQNGISSLRFDKRGIGKSQAAMTSESELRFETYTKDAVAWISMLKADKRFSEVIVMGHSEGSLIGMIAAGQANAGGFISVSGPGKSADKILQEQLKTQLPPQLMMESNKILESLKQGKTVAEVNASLAPIYRPSVQPYMISWMKYDPAKEIKKLKIPVLIVQGNTDLQVSVNDAKLLSASRPDAKLVIVDNMNHILKESVAAVNVNMGTYQNANLPLKSELIDILVNFIKIRK